jgi:hypothetical protein
LICATARLNSRFFRLNVHGDDRLCGEYMGALTGECQGIRRSTYAYKLARIEQVQLVIQSHYASSRILDGNNIIRFSGIARCPEGAE